MLIDSGLPNIFWVYAAEYATQIFNCLPTTTKFGHMSPVQARYGMVPSVAHFRRFGCLCYCHIPAESRAKGFVEKSYKSYFLGIDMPTQAYKVWVIDKSMVQISSNVLFDEFSKTKLPDQAVVPVDPNPRDVRNFTYLIGMVYRDDEDQLLYVSTRVVVQRGDIVVYRSVYVKENVVGQEEPRPIHVADVERMLEAFLLTHQPLVVLAGDVSATRVETLQTSLRATPTTSDGISPGRETSSDNIVTSGAKRLAETGSSHNKRHASESTAVQRPRMGQREATTAHVGSSGV
jgi:hypothetical protein